MNDIDDSSDVYQQFSNPNVPSDTEGDRSATLLKRIMSAEQSLHCRLVNQQAKDYKDLVIDAPPSVREATETKLDKNSPLKYMRFRKRTLDDMLAEFAGGPSLKAAFVAAIMDDYEVSNQVCPPSL